jgi:hypothetical protein
MQTDYELIIILIIGMPRGVFGFSPPLAQEPGPSFLPDWSRLLLSQMIQSSRATRALRIAR